MNSGKLVRKGPVSQYSAILSDNDEWSGGFSVWSVLVDFFLADCGAFELVSLIEEDASGF